MTEESVELDTVRELCRDQHRCIVLAVLAQQQRPLTVNDLTKAILKHNHDVPITEADAEVVAEIRDELVDGHVPTLTEEGAVEYDPERELLEPAVECDRLQSHLETVEADEPALELPVDL